MVTLSALGAQASVASDSSEFISEVIPIKHARAADVAAVLLKPTTNGVGATEAVSNSSAIPASGPAADQSGNTNVGHVFSQRLQSIVRSATPSGESQLTGQPPIVADERSNSLLIHATRQDMQQIKETISRLDIALAQVLVEAVILQITASGSNSLGTSYLAGGSQAADGSSFGTGALSKSNLASITSFSSAAATNSSASQPSGFEYLAKPATDLDSMVTALAKDSQVRILQRPRIQTSDGVAASLFVGESRPYPASKGAGGDAASSDPSARQILVGVTFEVTPVIKPNGFVTLDIHQKIDRVVGSTNIANVGQVPITSSTEAQAKVVVRDRETILLGGLIEMVKPWPPSGVPLLRDIPLLGPLFRGSTAPTERNELLVLIRSTILPVSEAAVAPVNVKSN